MTTRKHNSIIFLTTLGVYLGLVLVGAPTPQVFAHGALTRTFELTDEIEAKDDLDKNPDGEIGLNPYVRRSSVSANFSPTATRSLTVSRILASKVKKQQHRSSPSS